MISRNYINSWKGKQMTWGEFKKLVEDKGVEDTDYISYIDIGASNDFDVKRLREILDPNKDQKNVRIFVEII
jgi:hypothetical protein